jgi:hypothetical protein
LEPKYVITLEWAMLICRLPKLRLLKKIKGINQYETMFENIIKKYPNLTYDEFIKDIYGYANGTVKVLKQLRDEELVGKRSKREVNKIQKEQDTENKGIAFEINMITNHQDELKEISKSKDDFKLASDNPIYYKDGDKEDPLMIVMDGKDKPLHEVSLFDISNPTNVADCKYYPKQDYTSIQISKLIGNISFTPCYVEINNEIVFGFRPNWHKYLHDQTPNYLKWQYQVDNA